MRKINERCSKSSREALIITKRSERNNCLRYEKQMRELKTTFGEGASS
jgi:hypothetical protein